jgi:hypothetical protein
MPTLSRKRAADNLRVDRKRASAEANRRESVHIHADGRTRLIALSLRDAREVARLCDCAVTNSPYSEGDDMAPVHYAYTTKPGPLARYKDVRG